MDFKTLLLVLAVATMASAVRPNVKYPSPPKLVESNVTLPGSETLPTNASTQGMLRTRRQFGFFNTGGGAGGGGGGGGGGRMKRQFGFGFLQTGGGGGGGGGGGAGGGGGGGGGGK